MNLSKKRKNEGVTIVELMLVVAIVGIIASLAVPQYGGLINKKNILSESRRITSLLKLARSEARARGALVTVSRPAGTDWGGAITVTELRDDANEEIKVVEGRGTLSVDASIDDESITFNPRGWVHTAFSISICSSSGAKTDGRLIRVNRVGKIVEGPLGDENCAQ